ncbi:protein-lysine N-trimethyltransferase SMYD5-like isoform X1 [Branchiostoma floridae x Branchiostoma belcheri]
MAAPMDHEAPHESGTPMDISGVTIVQDPVKGKCLHATRSFKQGEIIFREKPVVSCQFLWNAMYKYTACDHCMRSMETAEAMSRRLANSPSLVLPFPQCCAIKQVEHVTCPHCQVAYCTESCRQEAWNKYHRVLCLGPSVHDSEHPLNKLAETWRNIHYPPETASIMMIARMIAMVKQAADKDNLLRTFAGFCQATTNQEEHMSHKLLGAEFQDQLELLRGLMVEALYEENLDQWFTPDGFRSIFAMIGRNGQGIGTSSLSVYVHNCDALELPTQDREKLDTFIDQLYVDIEQESGTFLNCEGSGLYSLQSCCNHSCEPSAEPAFDEGNYVLSMRALRDITEGEELFICYLDECERTRSRHSRQKLLRENYLFSCRCEKCSMEAEDPDVTSSEEEEDEEDGEGDEE